MSEEVFDINYIESDPSISYIYVEEKIVIPKASKNEIQDNLRNFIKESKKIKSSLKNKFYHNPFKNKELIIRNGKYVLIDVKPNIKNDSENNQNNINKGPVSNIYNLNISENKSNEKNKKPYVLNDKINYNSFEESTRSAYQNTNKSNNKYEKQTLNTICKNTDNVESSSQSINDNIGSSKDFDNENNDKVSGQYVMYKNKKLFKSGNNNSCDVCGESNDYISNLNYCCQTCFNFIHQTCYGSELNKIKPKEKNGIWKCERCIFKSSNTYTPDIKCYLCEDNSGILKKVVFDFGNNQIEKWSHMDCVEWNENLCTTNWRKHIKVDKIERNECYICKTFKGFPISCHKRGCNSHFHVRCAKKAKIINKWSENEKKGLNAKNINCHFHIANIKEDSIKFSNSRKNDSDQFNQSENECSSIISKNDSDCKKFDNNNQNTISKESYNSYLFLGNKRDRQEDSINYKINKILDEDNEKEQKENESVNKSINYYNSRNIETPKSNLINNNVNDKLVKDEISCLIDDLCISEKKNEIFKNRSIEKILSSNNSRSFFQKSLIIKQNKLQ